MNLEFSSGGVVFKKKDNKILWLITLSSPSKLYPHSYWRLPKGWLDDKNGQPGPLAKGERKAGEKELQKTALREVEEGSDAPGGGLVMISQHFMWQDVVRRKAMQRRGPVAQEKPHFPGHLFGRFQSGRDHAQRQLPGGMQPGNQPGLIRT